jgi:DNA-binding NtrC family response regulator
LRERWPGNVRQLKNVMERLAALHPGGVLGPADLAEDSPRVRLPAAFPRFHGRMRGSSTWPALKLSYAQAVLARCGGNVSAAAREAGVDRKTFYALLRREKEQQTGESIPQMEPESGE